MSDSAPRTIRIATRESQLALWQANFIADELRRVAPGHTVELAPVTTEGDRDRTSTLSSLGGVGVFTREVQKDVLNHSADLAVHSLKDLPTETVPGLTLAGIPARAPRFDALLLPHKATGTVEELPEGARIGTGSPRRQSQLLNYRPDLKMMDIRGNVETRIQKLDAGEYDAIILAEAGLRRLDMAQYIAQVLAPPLMLPAVGQAALGIECRADDEFVIELLEQISDENTRSEVIAERSCLRALRAGCHAPVATLTEIDGENLTMQAHVLTNDGTQRFTSTITDSTTNADQIGQQCANELIAAGASEVLNASK